MSKLENSLELSKSFSTIQPSFSTLQYSPGPWPSRHSAREKTFGKTKLNSFKKKSKVFIYLIIRSQVERSQTSYFRFVWANNRRYSVFKHPLDRTRQKMLFGGLCIFTAALMAFPVHGYKGPFRKMFPNPVSGASLFTNETGMLNFSKKSILNSKSIE